MQGLEAGAVETLIVWEAFEMQRVVIRNPHTEIKETKMLTVEGVKDPIHYKCPETSVALEIDEDEPFLDWIVANYKSFGCKLEFITDRSQEGNQFCKGFGGIGGLMRYKLEFDLLEEPDIDEADSDEDFM